MEQDMDFLCRRICEDALYCPMEDTALHCLGIRISRVASTFFGRETDFRMERPLALEEISGTGVFSEEEQAAFTGFSTLKRQVEWVSARLAAKLLVKKTLFPYLPLHCITLGKREKGAPFLEGFPEHAISLSHGGDWAFCGLSAKKTGKIGIDVEKVEKKDREAFSALAWSRGERNFLEKASDTEIVRHWTKKEAVLKVLGEGFHIPLKKVEIFPSGVYLTGIFCGELSCRTFAVGCDHVLSVVYHSL